MKTFIKINVLENNLGVINITNPEVPSRLEECFPPIGDIKKPKPIFRRNFVSRKKLHGAEISNMTHFIFATRFYCQNESKSDELFIDQMQFSTAKFHNAEKTQWSRFFCKKI